jgi:6-phosphofructokinase 1
MRRTDPIKVLEVMGRNAGWLAAGSALGRESAGEAPHLIFLPERPRSLDQMIEEVHAAYLRAGWALIVLCENQQDHAGRPIAGDVVVHTDPHGHPYYESAGAHLAREVQSRLGLRARYERPGSLQRTSAAALSDVDVREAEQVGTEAVRRALAGESDEMVGIQRAATASSYQIALNAVPLAEVSNSERRMPDEFIAPSGTDVTEAYLAYARPLIGAPLPRRAPRLLPL